MKIEKKKHLGERKLNRALFSHIFCLLVYFSSYLSKVESLPNYGVHFYAVTDKRHTPWYLGISYKGIAQYDYADRRHPRRVNHELSFPQPALFSRFLVFVLFL